MAYKFTGRIKEIGCECKKRFCKFDVDNTIYINEREIGVAWSTSDNDNLIKVPEIFTKISLCKYITLLNAQGKVVDIEFENETIKKVTIVK